MAKACANEARMSFIAIQGPELLSKYVGDSEKAIRNVFEKARQAAPSIIFFDEIDSIGVSRGDNSNSASDRVLCQILTEMDGVRGLEKVLVIGATNRVDILDKALLRPGRFDRIIEIALPDESTRKIMINSILKEVTISTDQKQFAKEIINGEFNLDTFKDKNMKEDSDLNIDLKLDDKIISMGNKELKENLIEQFYE